MEYMGLFSLITLAAEEAFKFTINWDAFLNSLPLMLYGMIGIFIVILAIMGGIKILFALFPTEVEKKKREEKKKNKAEK